MLWGKIFFREPPSAHQLLRDCYTGKTDVGAILTLITNINLRTYPPTNMHLPPKASASKIYRNRIPFTSNESTTLLYTN